MVPLRTVFRKPLRLGLNRKEPPAGGSLEGPEGPPFALKRGLVPNQVLTVDAMGQDLDAQVLPKSAGAPEGALSIFGSVLSARDGSSRRQLALDLGLGGWC